MGEQPGYIPPEAQQPEIPQVREGLSAIVLPELGKRDRYGGIAPATEQETMGKLNAFLEGLNKQGADIVSVFDATFDVGRRPGIAGNASETRKVAIVRKQTGSEQSTPQPPLPQRQ